MSSILNAMAFARKNTAHKIDVLVPWDRQVLFVMADGHNAIRMTTHQTDGHASRVETWEVDMPDRPREITITFAP